MNDFELDVLTRIAFGEEEPGDRDHLATILAQHPEAQRELDEMRLLCGDLGGLARVPEPQISFARVRHAIETADRPRRTFPVWSVLVGLAGAAAAFVVFTSLAKSPTVPIQAPTVASREPVPAPVAMAESSPENIDALVSDIMSTDMEPMAKPVRSVKAKARVAHRPSRPIVRRESPAVLAAPLATEFRPVEDANPESHSIVVVTGRPDPETGAARAFESTDSSSIEFRG